MKNEEEGDLNSAAFEILDGALVCLSGLCGAKCSEVPAFTGLRVLVARI